MVRNMINYSFHVQSMLQITVCVRVCVSVSIFNNFKWNGTFFGEMPPLWIAIGGAAFWSAYRTLKYRLFTMPVREAYFFSLSLSVKQFQYDWNEIKCRVSNKINSKTCPTPNGVASFGGENERDKAPLQNLHRKKTMYKNNNYRWAKKKPYEEFNIKCRNHLKWMRINWCHIWWRYVKVRKGKINIFHYHKLPTCDVRDWVGSYHCCVFFSSFAHQQLLIRKIHTKRNLMKIFAKINKGNLIKVY